MSLSHQKGSSLYRFNNLRGLIVLQPWDTDSPENFGLWRQRFRSPASLAQKSSYMDQIWVTETR